MKEKKSLIVILLLTGFLLLLMIFSCFYNPLITGNIASDVSSNKYTGVLYNIKNKGFKSAGYDSKGNMVYLAFFTICNEDERKAYFSVSYNSASKEATLSHGECFEFDFENKPNSFLEIKAVPIQE